MPRLGAARSRHGRVCRSLRAIVGIWARNRIAGHHALDLISRQRFELEQRLRDSFQLIALFGQDLACILVALADQPADFGVEVASKLVVNSTKSMTGHLLGGAGGLESVVSVLAIHHQVSPPTINIFNQDPECDLDYCANEARPMKIDAALKNNFGFGGTNGSLVFRRLR